MARFGTAAQIMRKQYFQGHVFLSIYGSHRFTEIYISASRSRNALTGKSGKISPITSHHPHHSHILITSHHPHHSHILITSHHPHHSHILITSHHPRHCHIIKSHHYHIPIFCVYCFSLTEPSSSLQPKMTNAPVLINCWVSWNSFLIGNNEIVISDKSKHSFNVDDVDNDFPGASFL